MSLWSTCKDARIWTEEKLENGKLPFKNSALQRSWFEGNLQALVADSVKDLQACQGVILTAGK